MSARDLIVVGAGPVGLSCAWRAARAGLRVSMLDDGEPAAGDVAAGMLGPWSELEHRDGAMHELLVRAAAYWPTVAAEIAAAGSPNPGYVRCGTLQVASRPEHIGALRHHCDLVTAAGRSAEWLPSRQLRDLEPGLGPTVVGGFSLPDEHQIDPPRLRAALRLACQAVGVESVAARAQRLVRTGGCVTGVACSDGAVRSAQTTLISAGWRSSALADPPSLRPVKGQILRLRTPDGAAPVSRVIRGPDAYIVPRPNGEVVVGGTVEERSDDTVTAGAITRLLTDAAAMVPDIRELALHDCAAGLRPATPDGLPAIGADATPGLLWAVGGFRHGILLAPLFAEGVLAELGHGQTGPFAPFAPTRYERTAS